MSRGSVGTPLSLPCGRCIGCRLERARQWAVRLLHESEMHEDSSFITLTYDDEHLPSNRSLSVPVTQLFMKRLRHRVGVPIRFFLCGEYGERLGRPHYHALIFGYAFPDKVLLSESNGVRLYRSEMLEDVWGFGFCSIGSVTFDSACYVAKYATKKVLGPKAAAHYGGRIPEFLTMSRRPGIGNAWITKFQADVYPSDEVIIKEFPARPPRYYDNVLKSKSDLAHALIGRKRQAAADALETEVSGTKLFPMRYNPDTHPSRLKVRKTVAEAKARLKSRILE